MENTGENIYGVTKIDDGAENNSRGKITPTDGFAFSPFFYITPRGLTNTRRTSHSKIPLLLPGGAVSQNGECEYRQPG